MSEFSKYRGPWIILLVFVAGGALAVIWMLAEIKRTQRMHDLSYPQSAPSLPGTVKAAPALVVVAPIAPVGTTSGGGMTAVLLSAAQQYSRDLKSSGAPMPAMVPLRALVQRGLVKPGDVGEFGDAEVFISLTANETTPHEILLEARYPNGTKSVLFVDGAVQQAR